MEDGKHIISDQRFGKAGEGGVTIREAWHTKTWLTCGFLHESYIGCNSSSVFGIGYQYGLFVVRGGPNFFVNPGACQAMNTYVSLEEGSGRRARFTRAPLAAARAGIRRKMRKMSRTAQNGSVEAVRPCFQGNKEAKRIAFG